MRLYNERKNKGNDFLLAVPKTYTSICKRKRNLQVITDMARELNIQEKDIPCLYLYNLKSKENRIISINSDDDMYGLIKNIIQDSQIN